MLVRVRMPVRNLPKTRMQKDPALPPVRLTGLAPVVGAGTAVLVLGSFPGAASLQAQQYYAHPRNQFWPLLQALWPQHPMPDRGDYPGRCAWLLARGLGLWDVYGACERVGSLDARIRHAEANDLAGLRRIAPGLEAVAHNGAESARTMRRLQALGFAVHRLPSTSPAHAAQNYAAKLAAWSAIVAVPNK